MSVPASVDRALARIAQGADVAVACAAEGVGCQADVVVDAYYDGKPVCTVTLPWVVEGHAVLFADDSAVAEERLRSLAAALAMPVCVVRRAA